MVAEIIGDAASQSGLLGFKRPIFSLLAFLLFAWPAASDLAAKSCPTKKGSIPPTVIGFAGWTMPMTSYHGSAIEQIVDRLRSEGMKAEVYPPEVWPEIAERLVAKREPEQQVILVGFSMGAAASIHVAQKLGAAGMPVRKVVVVEAWNPEPVPANVDEATHFYSTHWASEIRPGPGNSNIVENIDLNGMVTGITEASHVDMSRMAAVQEIVIDKIEQSIDNGGGKIDKNGILNGHKTKLRSNPTACNNADTLPKR